MKNMMKFYLDSQGSNHTGAAVVHTGWILVAVVVENKRKAPEADKCFLLDHFHYLNTYNTMLSVAYNCIFHDRNYKKKRPWVFMPSSLNTIITSN
jgi:hypothetical protein